MSEGTKKQYKQFEMKSIVEACIIMRDLLAAVISNINKFVKYSQEAIELKQKYIKCKDIPSEEYDSIHDKLLYRQRELLRFIADNQSSSFSYKMVRPIMEKKGFLKRNLNQDMHEILNELLDIRNFTFHNAQSMIVADLEIAKKRIPEELLGIGEIIPVLNPVYINRVESYSFAMLDSFIRHNEIRLEQFGLILGEMKKDYQELIDYLINDSAASAGIIYSHKVEYIEQVKEGQDSITAGSDIVSLAMGIQKGKYDGTDEAFEKCIKG